MTVTDETFQQEVLDFDGVVLVDFWAPWCGPCKLQGPVVDKIAEKYKDNSSIKITKLDTDENPKVSMNNQIFSIPTLILYKKGEVVDRLVGLRTQEELEQKIEELL